MGKKAKTFQKVAQVWVAIAFVWFAATAFAMDKSASLPILWKDVGQQAAVWPQSCECCGRSPLSFHIGKAFRAEVGGFARLDLIRDFDAIGDRYEFLTTSIPTDGRHDSRSTISARQSRLNLDVTHSRSSLRVSAEGDFFGAGGDFRLRHAYVEFDGLMIGQNWSAFQDELIIPNTLDYEGPVGMVFVRQPQLRLSVPWRDHVDLAVAIEDASESDLNVDIPFSGSDDHPLPDLVARLRYELPSAHLQISSLLRQIAFRSDVVAGQHVTGWGVAASGSWRPRETVQFYAQVVVGEGVARYVEDLAGFSSDAALDSNGNLVALTTIGVVSGWQHHWNDCLQSNLVFGHARVSNSAGQAPDAFHQSEYFSGNIIWSPYKDVDLGCELLWGNRHNKSRAKGEAARFQFTTTLRF
jgi:hypothetical protein